MLWIISSPTTTKLIYTDEHIIEVLNAGKVIFEANVVNKESRTKFCTLRARLVFAELRQTFSIAPVLYHFDLECYIWIKTEVLDFLIGRILNPPILDGFCQWYPVVYFSWKMISEKTRQETHNNKLLAII